MPTCETSWTLIDKAREFQLLAASVAAAALVGVAATYGVGAIYSSVSKRWVLGFIQPTTTKRQTMFEFGLSLLSFCTATRSWIITLVLKNMSCSNTGR
jgi:hypothetical protein